MLEFAAFIFILALFVASSSCSVIEELHIGYSAAPNTKGSSPTFQPLLTDPTGVFSFGFLQLDLESSRFDLVVIHNPSSFPLWRGSDSGSGFDSKSNSVLFFNGSLVLENNDSGILWSSGGTGGDRVLLRESSDLQVMRGGNYVVWSSFDHASDTLMEGQNFTMDMKLVSGDGRFLMQIQPSYLAMFMEFPGVSPAAMYWKHKAMEEKGQVVAGGGKVYARVEVEGFIGMYQSGRLLEVMAFDTFNKNVTAGVRRVTLDSDGNLRAWFWDKVGSAWVKDMEAITDPCGLPTACKPYETCVAVGGGKECRCLGGGCLGSPESGDLCGAGAVRVKGVDVANRELLGLKVMGSLEECEVDCEKNCSCWGAVYSNVSGDCYAIGYPVQTLLSIADDRRAGYFKVAAEKRRGMTRRAAGAVLLTAAAALAAAAAAAFLVYRVFERRQRRGAWAAAYEDGQALSPGPYKGITSPNSFRSFAAIELAGAGRGNQLR